MKKSLVFILTGVLSLGLSTGWFKSGDVKTIDYEKYGGDAYTGIQKAAAKTGNNVAALNDTLSFGFGSILLVAGVAFLLTGISMQSEESVIKKRKAEETKD